MSPGPAGGGLTGGAIDLNKLLRGLTGAGGAGGRGGGRGGGRTTVSGAVQCPPPPNEPRLHHPLSIGTWRLFSTADMFSAQERRKLLVSEARRLLEEEEVAKAMDQSDIVRDAIKNVEVGPIPPPPLPPFLPSPVSTHPLDTVRSDAYLALTAGERYRFS
jgi:hypothetical protein